MKVGTVPPTAGAISNRIAYNARGVTVISGTGNTVRGNAIYRNTAFDLDLGNDGPTVNDAGDADTGPNNKQNYPQLGATGSSGGLSVSLTLNSAPGTYTVDFYSGGYDDGDDDDCGAGSRDAYNPSVYLGSATVSASSSAQNVSFAPVGLSAEGTLVATATSNATGDTSEYSNCTPFVNVKPAASATSATTNEDTPVTVTLTATDPQGPFPLTFAIASPPTKGTLGPIVPSTPTCTANPCTATVVYTPNANTTARTGSPTRRRTARPSACNGHDHGDGRQRCAVVHQGGEPDGVRRREGRPWPGGRRPSRRGPATRQHRR